MGGQEVRGGTEWDPLECGVQGRGPSCLGPSLRLSWGTPRTRLQGACAHPACIPALEPHGTRVMKALSFAELSV